MIYSPLLTSLLLSSVLSVSVVPSDFFKSSMCSLQFSSDVRSVHPSYNVVAGRGFIASVKQCSVVIEKKLNTGSYINTLSELKGPEILFCSNRMLYSANTSNNLDPVTEIYGMGSETSLITPKDYCKHNVTRREAVLTIGTLIFSGVTSSGKAVFASHDTTSGVILTTNYAYTRDINNYYRLFSHDGFVYAVYSDSSDSAYLSRVCENDKGEAGQFISYAYSHLECVIDQTVHNIVIDSYYDEQTSKLYVLFTRTPKEYSASVMCSFTLSDVKSSFDSGQYSYYSKTGEQKTAAGSPVLCGVYRTNQEKSLVQLNINIQAQAVVFKKLMTYSMFDVVRRNGDLYFYLSDGYLIDVWLEQESTSTLLHSIELSNDKVTRLYLHSDSETVNMYLIAGTKVLHGSVDLCGHIKDPYQCYSDSTPACVWSNDQWGCVPSYKCSDCSSGTRTFSARHPTGLSNTVQEQCYNRTEFYPADSTDKSISFRKRECPALQPPANTITSTMSNECLGQTVFKCDAYSELISGEEARTCKEDGQWTGVPPLCRLKQCSKLTAPSHGYLSTIRQTVGTRAYFNCENCYELKGSSSVTCNMGGAWSVQNLPLCQQRICPSIIPNENTTITSTGVLCGEKTFFRCKNGYRLHSGDLTMRCDSRGWIGTKPTCRVTSCPTLTPPNAILSTRSSVIGTVLRMYCNACYKVYDSNSVYTSQQTTCNKDGDWSHVLPMCSKVYCPVRDPGAGVSVVSLDVNCEGRAQYQCAPGWELASGDLLRTCDQDGSWSGTEPVCVVNNCPVLSNDSRLFNISSDNRSVGSVVTSLPVQCHGYPTLSQGFLSSKSLQCTPEGRWNDTNLTPTPVHCPPLDPPHNVHIVVNKVGCGEETEFRCADNSTLVNGTLTTQCLPNGTWSNSFPLCQERVSNEESNEESSVAKATGRAGARISQADNNFLIVCAVSGWVLFVIACVVCGLYILRIQKEKEVHIARLQKQGSSKRPYYVRQITSSTTVSEF